MNQYRWTFSTVILLALGECLGIAQSPLLGQSEPSFQIDPHSQQQRQLQQQLSMPGTPALIYPIESEAMQIPNGAPARVSFQWQAEPGGRVEKYKLCVFEAARTCEQSGSEVYIIPGNTQEFVTSQGLPTVKFRGKSLKWSVAACTTTAMRQRTFPGTSPPASNDQCRTSPPRNLFWPLPAPERASVSRSQGTDPTIPRYGFLWTAVDGAKAYLFCLYEGPQSLCNFSTTQPTNNPMIIDKGGTDYSIEYDLTQFRGHTVRWTVAACTHLKITEQPTSPLPERLRCTYQQGPGNFESIRIGNPLLPPILHPPHWPEGTLAPESAQPPIRMSWDIQHPRDVRSIKVCVITARGPGGQSVAPQDRMANLTRTSPYSCEQRNVLMNPIRNARLTSCTFVRPLLDTGDPSKTVFGFAVASCNEENQCWYAPLAVIHDEFRPFGPQARYE